MVPSHLPEEHIDSVRLWTDPAEAGGTGGSMAPRLQVDSEWKSGSE